MKFDKWNKIKKEIHKKDEIPFFRNWQIWYISMWVNIWFEQDWKNDTFSRPVLILKKFNKDIFLWIPTTTVEKEWRFYFDIWKIRWEKNFLILSQVRLYSSKRLENIIWWIDKDILKEIKQKISKLIE